MYLVSLIIPIYNAENFLENTINSVINQSIGFHNIELILIDDNSKDDSRKIINEYSKKYDNIHCYYSDKNHGFPGFGRNVGLENSTTEYVMFMDSDDELDKDICKKLYETITSENVDIVCCDKATVDSIGIIKKTIKYENGIKIGNHILIKYDDILLFNNISVWNKIYRKQIIKDNKIKFLEDSSAEDFAFTMEYFLRSKELIYLKNYYGYFWNINPDSLSHVVTKEHMNDLLKVNNYIMDKLNKANKLEYAEKIFKENIIYLLTQSSYLKINKSEFITILKRIHDFETKINFNLKLDAPWANFVNNLILNQKYTIARLMLKSIDKLRSSKTIRKLNR